MRGPGYPPPCRTASAAAASSTPERGGRTRQKGGMMGTVNERVTWLGEQLDEDERVAKQAADLYPTPWRFERDSAVDANGDDMALGYDDSGAILGEHAEHIVRHDPSRVLRDVAADRKIIAEYQQLASKQIDGFDDSNVARAASKLTLDWVIRVRAERFADRPGYQEEWRP